MVAGGGGGVWVERGGVWINGRGAADMVSWKSEAEAKRTHWWFNVVPGSTWQFFAACSWQFLTAPSNYLQLRAAPGSSWQLLAAPNSGLWTFGIRDSSGFWTLRDSGLFWTRDCSGLWILLDSRPFGTLDYSGFLVSLYLSHSLSICICLCLCLCLYLYLSLFLSPFYNSNLGSFSEDVFVRFWIIIFWIDFKSSKSSARVLWTFFVQVAF